MNIMKSTRSTMAVALGSAALMVTGCAGTYGANEVRAGEVGATSTVYEGTVMSVREVTIRPDNTYLGTGTGAVIGGVAGSQIGGGDEERAVGAVAGAVLGGIVGSQVDKAANTRPGYAYTIRMDSGEVKEIVQGADIYIQPGTPVFVAFGTERTRVTPQAGY